MDCLNLRMAQGVLFGFPAIASPSNDLPIAHHDRPDRHLALICRLARQFERSLHIFFLFGHENAPFVFLSIAYCPFICKPPVLFARLSA